MICAAVHASRYNAVCIVRVVGDDLFDLRARSGNQFGSTRGGRFFDGTIWMANHVDEGINLVVTQRL
ncbi:Uncharacterised protein [Vibrio cholerae]|nr:Uncharacterised protein [Vibrio cholerae]CSH89972.1 Uncharacterised protein [Vibrio cholerae]